jgi:hypothetical protein
MAFYISGPKLLFNCTLLYRLYDVLYFIILLYSILYWCILQLRKKKLNKKKKKTFIRDNRNFDSTGVKLYIFIHNEVRDFDKNSTQPEIRVNRVWDNESQLYKHYFEPKFEIGFKSNLGSNNALFVVYCRESSVSATLSNMSV